jgi:hypothetical protein
MSVLEAEVTADADGVVTAVLPAVGAPCVLTRITVDAPGAPDGAELSVSSIDAEIGAQEHLAGTSTPVFDEATGAHRLSAGHALCVFGVAFNPGQVVAVNFELAQLDPAADPAPRAI